MILEVLPDIPRLFTGIAEWSAVLVYVLLSRPRFSGWRRVAIIVALLPTLILLQVIVGLFPLSVWIMGMALAAIAMTLSIHACSQLPLKASAFVAARAFILAEFMQSFHWQLWVHWRPEPTPPELWSLDAAVYFGSLAVIYSALSGLAYVGERINLSSSNWARVDSYHVATALAIAVLTFAFSNVGFVLANTPFSGSTVQDVFYIRTLVALIGWVALYVQQSRMNHESAVTELVQTHFMMERQHAQYLQSERNAENLNRIHHDLKHIVHAIREEESSARRAEYLTRIESAVHGYESVIRTGHAPIDIILSTHMARCIKEGILMTTMVDGAALKFIDLMSLSAVFGNALDNAIEASVQIPETDQRIIKVVAFTRHDFVIIQIENYWPYPVEFIDELPQTTKAEQARHGVGTRSIRTITQSYSGTATFCSEDDWFKVRLLIPRHSDVS